MTTADYKAAARELRAIRMEWWAEELLRCKATATYFVRVYGITAMPKQFSCERYFMSHDPIAPDDSIWTEKPPLRHGS